jgi:hypothetical protein
MMRDNKQDSDSNQKSSLLRASIGSIAFVLLIILLMILGNKLNTIEDELQLCTPETTYGIHISASQIVYVPVYTYIESGDGETQMLDAVLSIRNSDPAHSITVSSARFYDGKGNLVQEYLDGGPVKLAPLEARTLTLSQNYSHNIGAAANFIVEWNSAEPVYEPIVDAIMFGFNNGKSITFKSVGRPLAQRLD